VSHTPLLGRGSRWCWLCQRRRAVVGWCDACRKSYDRMSETSDGTVLAALRWAARRARQFSAKKVGRP
jgi:hypothetical protein